MSAPSGTGKTTLAERLVQILPNLRMSRSYTSRPARAGERDGVDYNFVSRAQFDGMIERDEFLEWADVFGNLYGTSRIDTERLQASGQDVVLVIDVQGATQVKRSGIDHTSIFMLPPSFEILERRLRGRSADSEAAMQKRLAAARAEAGCYVDYDYVVINDATRADGGAAAGDHRGGTLADASDEPRGGRHYQEFSLSGSVIKDAMALIALGVSGGIGAYKAVEIARGLQKNGHDVVAVMTKAAREVRRAADLRGHHAPRR